MATYDVDAIRRPAPTRADSDLQSQHFVLSNKGTLQIEWKTLPALILLVKSRWRPKATARMRGVGRASRVSATIELCEARL